MIEAALWLLAVQGLIGAFDTVYYHEWKARLPARAATASAELCVHAFRDFLYAAIFCTLPWLAWHGAFTLGLAAIFLGEITLTFTDFVVEKRVRAALGDVYAGERITHAAMAIVYGAMLANLVPTLLRWWAEPTGFVLQPVPVPAWLRVILVLMGAGVALSGVRDFAAALGLRWARWPWRRA
jgi:hypothetical protein